MLESSFDKPSPKKSRKSIEIDYWYKSELLRERSFHCQTTITPEAFNYKGLTYKENFRNEYRIRWHSMSNRDCDKCRIKISIDNLNRKRRSLTMETNNWHRAELYLTRENRFELIKQFANPKRDQCRFWYWRSYSSKLELLCAKLYQKQYSLNE